MASHSSSSPRSRHSNVGSSPPRSRSLERSGQTFGSETELSSYQRVLGRKQSSPACMNPYNPNLYYGLGHNELAEIHEAYRMLIENEKGLITVSKLHELLEGLGQMHITEADIEERIRCCTGRGDGVISFAEFAVLMGFPVLREELEEMAAPFRALDKDGSGTITTAQFCQLMATQGERSPPEELEAMIQDVDPGGKGTVKYMEFLSNLAARTGMPT